MGFDFVSVFVEDVAGLVLVVVLVVVVCADAAKEIVSAARRGVTVKYVPWKWRIVSFVLHSLPSFIFRRLNF